MAKKKGQDAIELSEESMNILQFAQLKVNTQIFDSSVIRHRHSSQSAYELLQLVATDFSAVRDEACALYSKLTETTEFTEWRHFVGMHPPSAEVIAYLVVLNEKQIAVTARLAASAKGRKSANALHDKPGGNREKQAKIRELWKTGKYSSRDICAEQECAALEMSFSAARKALRRIPGKA
jgi:hypothetical protein